MITLRTLDNGFTYLDIRNDHACAKIALQGAHIFHYQRHDESPLLWLSDASILQPGTAIRGGIPICWPWFGMPDDPALPQHGFARVLPWDYEIVTDHNDVTVIVFRLQPSTQTKTFWPYRFELSLQITVNDQLGLKLTTANTDVEIMTISSALHTYFAITDIHSVKVLGLEGKPYWDALSDTNHIQAGGIMFSAETDRVYQHVDNTIKLLDPKRTISIDNNGSSSVVVWNPWIEKSTRMSAMMPDSYLSMLCIETANAREDSITLSPGQSHTLGTRIH